MPRELTTDQKLVVLQCRLLLFYTTTDHFLIGLWCAVKSGFYMTTGDDQLSDWSEKMLQSTTQSQTSTQKRSWSLFSGLLPIDPLELSESQRSHYIWKVCSADWWESLKTAISAAGIGQQNWPNFSLLHDNAWLHVAQPVFQKLNEWDYEVLRHLPCSLALSPTGYRFFKHLDKKYLSRENTSTTSRREKMLSKSP